MNTSIMSGYSYTPYYVEVSINMGSLSVNGDETVTALVAKAGSAEILGKITTKATVRVSDLQALYCSTNYDSSSPYSYNVVYDDFEFGVVEY